MAPKIVTDTVSMFDITAYYSESSKKKNGRWGRGEKKLQKKKNKGTCRSFIDQIQQGMCSCGVSNKPVEHEKVKTRSARTIFRKKKGEEGTSSRGRSRTRGDKNTRNPVIEDSGHTIKPFQCGGIEDVVGDSDLDSTRLPNRFECGDLKNVESDFSSNSFSLHETPPNRPSQIKAKSENKVNRVHRGTVKRGFSRSDSMDSSGSW